MKKIETDTEAQEENFSPEDTEGRRPEVDEGEKFSCEKKIPSTEVNARPVRRNFTTSYKLKILNLADNCTEKGGIGALLRKEGLYSSHLTSWRRQRNKGILDGLSAKKRGVKKQDDSLVLNENKKLKRENEKLKKELEKASIIIDFQKKTSALLKMIDQE